MWVVCRLSVFCEPFTDRAVGFPYILFFYIFYIQHLVTSWALIPVLGGK